VIALALYTHGSISSFYIPNWVKITAGLTIAAGTYVGGWRIIRTLGQRIYKMQPEHGLAAQIAAGTTLYAGTRLGIPFQQPPSSQPLSTTPSPGSSKAPAV
jgi:inorganic phosphate transporter, PiT family